MNSSVGARTEVGVEDFTDDSNGVPIGDLAPVWVACINEEMPGRDARQPLPICASAFTASAYQRETSPIKPTRSEGPTEAGTPSPARKWPPVWPMPFEAARSPPNNSVMVDKSFTVDSSPRQTSNSSVLTHVLNKPDPLPYLPPHLNVSSSIASVNHAFTDSELSRSRGTRGRDGPMREQISRFVVDMTARMQPASADKPDEFRNSTSSQLRIPPSPGQRPAPPSPNPAASHRLVPSHAVPRNSAQHASRKSLEQKSLQDGPGKRRENDWTTWDEVNIKVYGLNPSVETVDLWKRFSREGSVTMIKIFEDSKGNRNGKASIRFSPRPAKSFWLTKNYFLPTQSTGTLLVRLQLEPQRGVKLIATPGNPRTKYPECMTLAASSIDFGFMYDKATMMSMYSVHSAPQAEIHFRQNMRYQELVVEFNIKIQDPRPVQNGSVHGNYNRNEILRFNIPFSQLQVIYHVQDDKEKLALVISSETPPTYFRKWNEVNAHEEGANHWSQNDAWYRQTDIVYNPACLKSEPVTLKKTISIIDIGRWTTYRFVFDIPEDKRQLFNRISDAFRDHNIEIKEFAKFKLVTKREPAVWDFIDHPVMRDQKITRALDELMVENTAPVLTFPVRYQLEVCISQGYLNEHNMSNQFISKLIETDEQRAQDILEFVADQKLRIYDPMKIFDINVVNGRASRLQIPHYCAYIYSATITPSTVYYHTPTVETSNRIIRRYSEHADRFLRVRFTDEKFKGKIRATDKDTMNEVFTRVKRAMINGLKIGDRHYEFLAFGNSQFREHGAYFIAPLPHFDAQRIRDWMGMFKDIKGVALYASRLGQCFSTTRAISGSKVEIKQIKDVKLGKFCFTDGVGKISAFLAQLAASELGIDQSANGTPSVFQFRLGGCKGVLAVSPDAKMREVHIRPSQYKFPAIHEGLEIIRCSQFASSSLNRQLIVILSALGVPDSTFIHKLKMQLSDLERAMTDERVALALLQKDIDANQITLTMAGMILDGFFASKDPFLMSLLRLWRAWSTKYLKEKAKILISDGALLLGCTDETGQLKGHWTVSEEPATPDDKEASLPEIFVQLSKGPDDKPQVIKGPMLVARNPSLHPGDIRVVRGVDIPQLRHLKDVVVFPQTGDRDIPSMCSGGDLDGDDFLVMWDKDLLSHNWNQPPMDYTPPEKEVINRDVTINDITSFFVTYMKNDTLPTIAYAHLAQADFADDGVMDEKCLKLAALHSMAVDFVKTGQPARMPRELKPQKWPHFMDKKHLSKDQQYHSKKVLGKLFDQVELVDFLPAFEAQFDERILQAYELNSKILQDAAEVKSGYDEAVRRVMAQHQIQTEFEIWSTLVLHHAQDQKDFKFHEIVGEIANTLKIRFREACYEKAGGKTFEQIGPFAAAMYKVTSDQLSQALRECEQTTFVGGQEKPKRKMVASSMPFMSFPWLFHGVLGKIATGSSCWLAKNGSVATTAAQEIKKPSFKKNHLQPDLSKTVDDLVTADGVTHRGDLLELFDDLIDSEKQPVITNGATHREDVFELFDDLIDSEKEPVTANGVTHREDVLELFDDFIDSEKEPMTANGITHREDVIELFDDFIDSEKEPTTANGVTHREDVFELFDDLDSEREPVTANGVTHRGDVFELCDDLIDSERKSATADGITHREDVFELFDDLDSEREPVTANGVTHRGDVFELCDDLIDYEKEPKPAVSRTPSNYDSGNPSTPAASGTAGATVDELLFGDHKEGFFPEANPGQKPKDQFHFNLDNLMDISTGTGQDLPDQLGQVSSLVNPSPLNIDDVQEDKTGSQSDSEEKIVHLAPARNVMDYLAEYSDGLITVHT